MSSLLSRSHQWRGQWNWLVACFSIYLVTTWQDEIMFRLKGKGLFSCLSAVGVGWPYYSLPNRWLGRHNAYLSEAALYREFGGGVSDLDESATGEHSRTRLKHLLSYDFSLIFYNWISHVCMYVCVHMYVCVYICVYVCVCMYVCVHVCM